jgi:tetratricopeptide (TPR) repeat protein
VALDRRDDFQRMARHRDVRGYITRGRFHTPTIVIPGDADRRVVAHELVHHVSWYVFPRQPSWLSEALARFVDTVALDDGAATARAGLGTQEGGGDTAGCAGLASPNLVSFLVDDRGSFPADLQTSNVSAHGSNSARYSAWSWLLYHWLWNTRSSELAAFTTRLSSSEDPAEAWRASFPDLDLAKNGARAFLEANLRRYMRTGRFLAYCVEAKADTRYTVAALPAPEVHLLLLDARLSPPTLDESRAEAEEALREDPTHPIALASLARPGEALTMSLRAATAARPDDWRAWLLLGSSLNDREQREEKEAALRRAAALRPDSASTRNELAWLLVQSGRAKEALPHANAAVDLAPWSSGAIDTLAVTAAELGKCKEALILEDRALGLLHPDDPRRASIQKSRGHVEERCLAGSRPLAQ